MASISATFLFPLSRAVEYQLHQNRNCKSSRISLTGSRGPSRAVLSSSSTVTTTQEAANKNSSPTLREICQDHVPEHVLRRTEEIGFVSPTDIQREGLSVLFSGRDCVLHAQAEPPTVVVATIGSLCQLIEKHIFKLDSMRVLVIDEVDFLFNSSKQVSYLKKLLASYSSCNDRQTVFASASIPQHRRFLHDCIQQKWTKNDVVHVHVNSIQPLPLCLHHRFMICSKGMKHQTLLSLLQSDAPESGIIFVGEQSEKSKKAGNAPSTTLLIDFLKTSYEGSSEILLLEEDMNFNSRAASLLEVRQGGGYLLVSTDIAARGIDLPETTHIYNFDLPRTAVDYLHRAGRTGRKPFSDKKCTVTNIITSEEQFVLQRYENELKFNCEELTFQVQC